MAHEVLLFSSDFAKAKVEIESLGGAVKHQFSTRAFVARIPEGTDVGGLSTASVEMPEDLDDASLLAIKAWRSRGSKFQPSKVQADEKRKWDAPGFEPPGYDQ